MKSKITIVKTNVSGEFIPLELADGEFFQAKWESLYEEVDSEFDFLADRELYINTIKTRAEQYIATLNLVPMFTKTIDFPKTNKAWKNIAFEFGEEVTFNIKHKLLILPSNSTFAFAEFVQPVIKKHLKLS